MRVQRCSGMPTKGACVAFLLWTLAHMSNGALFGHAANATSSRFVYAKPACYFRTDKLCDENITVNISTHFTCGGHGQLCTIIMISNLVIFLCSVGSAVLGLQLIAVNVVLIQLVLSVYQCTMIGHCNLPLLPQNARVLHAFSLRIPRRARNRRNEG